MIIKIKAEDKYHIFDNVSKVDYYIKPRHSSDGNIVEQIKDDEIDAYEDQEQNIWEYLWAMLGDLLEAVRNELLIAAAKHVALGAAWALIPPLFLANPSAIAHGLAAAGLATAGLGLALAGFEEGAVFDQPTLLPPHMVAEGGVSEAYLPLSPRIFGNIGQGIVDALSGPTATPALAGAGGMGDTINVDISFDKVYVRDEQDITRIAEETHSLWRSRMRGIGRNV